MVVDKARAGTPGEPMSCDAGTRAARERAMVKLATLPFCVGHLVMEKLKTSLTLQNVSRELELGENQAFSLMIADMPTSTLEQHQLEERLGLAHGSLDRWLS